MALRIAALQLILTAGCVLGGCQSVPDTQEGRDALRERDVPKAETALKLMLDKDSSIQGVIEDAYGYAIFPSVASGALIVGGDGGDGVVFKQGQPWGHAKLASGSIGLQIGGETYTELVVLKTEGAFENFTGGQFKFAAGVSATAVESGAALNAKFNKGMAVLVMTNGGLMARAAVGGQNFTTQPYQID